MPRNNVNNFDKFERMFKLPNQGLRTYFGNVVKGNPNVYDSPFAKGETTKDLLDSWNEELVSINNEWPTLYEFEMDLAKKVGPMSVMLPLSKRMKDIESYYTGIHLPSEPVNDRAVKAVISEWSSARGLTLRSEKRTNDKMRLSTNSGSPYFTKRSNAVNLTLPAKVWQKEDLVLQQLPQYYGQACAVLGWRGQEGGPSSKDVKQRVVWMFPYAVNLKELQVYQPLIEAAQRFNIVPSWVSMEAVDKRITQLFDTKSSKDLIVCTDFTAFDQHFGKQLQNCAFTILRSIFTPRNIDGWLEQIFNIKYMIPLAIDYGKVIYGEHGMGSGSGGTNADETLAHRALQYEAAISKGAMLNPNSQCLGDDGVLSYPGITVEDVVQSYARHGLEMNHSKQYASTQDCTYLRRWHHNHYRINGVCVGVYSTMRALGRLRYLERYHSPEEWGPEAVAMRQLSIIENVKYHPLKERFADFCMKRDKYRLGIDIPGFLDRLERGDKELMHYYNLYGGYTMTQLQSENTGITSWWIFNYLKAKA